MTVAVECAIERGPEVPMVLSNVAEQYFGDNTQNGEDYFTLDGSSIIKYQHRKPNFGYNGLGEFVFYRTYSRIKDDGNKETFFDTVKRVIEGCYEIQRRHCRRIHIPWDYDKALESACEMFERMWEFKFLPPGRGLWMMGTPFMWQRGSAALCNCAFVSTDDISESDPAEPFCFLMDMSMLGVGVGFDTKGAGRIMVRHPASETNLYIIQDSREGWVDSVRTLIHSYTIKPHYGRLKFDYSEIRKAGEPIKGFGGKASGPSILMELHGLIRDHLECCIGKTLSSTDIVDLMNYIGKCVVAGNVRRSAELALGDPDDVEYRRMKDPQLYGRELQSHRWASNNSLLSYVGMDYSDAAEQIAKNGEPGFQWLNNIRDYGRMIDGRQPGIDGRAKGTNPCFTGDMRLLTSDGYVKIYDRWLAGGMCEYDDINQCGVQEIINRRGKVLATNVYRTGVNVNVYRVRLSDNSYIDATESHQFIVVDKHRVKRRPIYTERRVQLIDLCIGQLIPLNQTQYCGTFHDPAYAELAGWCVGDGSLSPQRDGQTRAKCSCYEDDIIEVMPRLSSLMHELYLKHNKSSHQSPVYAGWQREQPWFEHVEEHIGSCVLGRLLRADGVVSGNKHHVPNSIWRGTRETVAAFIRGLASADGYVHIADNGTIGVRIWQSNQQLLQDCRLLLNQLGIAGAVHHRAKATKKLMNDGKGGKKWYYCKPGWELIVSGRKQVELFLNTVGFIQASKQVDAREWLATHHESNNSNTGRYVRITSIEYLGQEDTYCLTEFQDHQVVVEGYQIGNCGEQSLESYELCNLVETFPANHIDADDYMRTLKFAYLYAKTVTLLPTHNPRTNQVTLRNRRIGLSQSGIVQAFAKFGRRAVISDFCDAGYNEVRRWDNIYSEWLCVQRSIKCTSIKPSGTVSLLAGATPGIHYPEARYYWRRVRVAKNSILIKILEDAGFEVEQCVSDAETMVVKFAVSEHRVRPVHEVSIWEQMQNAVTYQRYWADNQVSCTVQFQPHEAAEIATVLEAYEDQLKGISFLPHDEHGYAQAPYEACDQEDVEQYNSRLCETDYGDYIHEAVGSRYCDGDKCTL